MKLPYHRIIVLTVLGALVLCVQVSHGTTPTSSILQTGEAIFQHRWQPGQPASVGGDGLGPVHNDVSCVACHFQGGVGGGGGIEKNATVLSLGPKPARMSEVVFIKTAAKVHPGLIESPVTLRDSIVLHKFSTDAKYNASRQRFVGLEMPVSVADESRDLAEKWVANKPVRVVPHQSGINMMMSQRNSPALFGIGLINRVPDELLRNLEQAQSQRGLVSGRVSDVGDRVGKFGWKAQTATLPEFVRDACANEIGLQVPGADQAKHPMHLDYEPAGFDLNQAQLASLTTYVASLPAPKRITPADESLAAIAHRGRQLFAKAGCAECHVETLSAGLENFYSDLLLHDMGSKLADPVPASAKTVLLNISIEENEATPLSPIANQPTRNSQSRRSTRVASPVRISSIQLVSSSPRPSRQPTGGSYGGSSTPSSPGMLSRNGAGTVTMTVPKVVPTNRKQEWRTPPLWGVAETGPYLHDGRASTLTEAILYHGGEAKFSVRRFLQLAPADRIAVVEFLKTLVAPNASEI